LQRTYKDKIILTFHEKAKTRHCLWLS